jgi:GntR family transcriptional regulator
MPHLPKNGIPFYIQIRESLREQIAQGILSQGERLPSEDELAAEYGVSRMTVRQGLSNLLDEGLLYRKHGLGTFVSNSNVERDHRRLTNFFESCRRSGKQPGAEVVRFEVIPVSRPIAEVLNLSPGDPVIRITTLRAINGKPVTLHDAQLPARLFPGLRDASPGDLGLESRHVWELIQSYGYNVSHVTERLEAQLADEQLAQQLNVTPGSPILYGARVVYATDGTALKYADCYNRGDKVSLTVDLSP